MKRRAFINGAVAVAVSAALPGGDGVALESMAHPKYTYKTFRTARLWEFEGKTMKTLVPVGHELTERMANALAKSMMQNMEMVAANVYNRGLSAASLEELEVEIENE